MEILFILWALWPVMGLICAVSRLHRNPHEEE